MDNQKYIDLSRSSPKGGKRGCLCKDTLKYSVKCCDGTLWAQGIGSTVGEGLFGNKEWQNINGKWNAITDTWNNT